MDNAEDFAAWLDLANPVDETLSVHVAPAAPPNSSPKPGFWASPWNSAELGDVAQPPVSLVDGGSHSTLEFVSLADLERPSRISPVQDETHVANVGTRDTPRTSSKSRTRFTPKIIAQLREWFSAHRDHPYASEEELEFLQQTTGLNRKQIFMWLANARRRGPSAGSSGHSTPISGGEFSPGPRGINIPSRRATPTPFEHMNPLERWQHSPPEHEAANASAIAQAVSASDSLSSPATGQYPFTSDREEVGSNRSKGKSNSVSSFETSGSSRGSSSSAHSARSQDSLRALRKTYSTLGSRRRRMANRRRPAGNRELHLPQHIYQCTFCPETFKTKYDWQRHEKSLHLSLDQWVCSPGGSQATDATGRPICVYCGIAEPNEQHLEGHHHTNCTERPEGERTFYRKDHLYQHLKLVHKAQFLPLMDLWKITTEKLESRCGFCDIRMDTWTARLNHIAAHFKAGKSMADWKGDWGFDPSVVEMLDNAMPPYLIHYERNTPLPLTVSLTGGRTDTSIETATLPTSYELIKSEMRYYVEGNETNETIGGRGKFYLDDFLHYESCCIIFGSEAHLSTRDPPEKSDSWLRDLLLLSSPDITERAKLQPLNWVSKARLSQLRIHGKKSIFEGCDFEARMLQYISGQSVLGLMVTDDGLQGQACAIVDHAEATSPTPSRRFAEFLRTLIRASISWLIPLQLRSSSHTLTANLTDGGIATAAATPNEIQFVDSQLSTTLPFYPVGPAVFASGHLWRAELAPLQPSTGSHHSELGQAHLPTVVPSQSSPTTITAADVPGLPPFNVPIAWQELGLRHLTKELYRFVAVTMSPNNPNRHVPTDEELQYQARWIDYDDDDPWNQTYADNPEWLRDFKKLVGLPYE